MSAMILRTIPLPDCDPAAGRRTTMRLEPEFWDGLDDIAARKRVSVSDLLACIPAPDAGMGNRASAVRVHVLQHYRDAAGKPP